MKQIKFGKPLIGQQEKDAVLAVLQGDTLVHGPRAKTFEAQFAAYTGAPHAVSVSSCTAALHLCYFYLGIGPGDEVIVPAQTHTATAHAVEFTGARPVFVDAEKNTGNIDIEQIEENISDRTRALSVVHFLGMPVDMDRVLNIAKKYDLFVVEDCALSIGATFKGTHSGLLGDAGCFSFYPVKHMTTAEGGMLITKLGQLAKKVVRQKAFGVDRTVSERKVPGVYDVDMLGFNYRMSELHAAIGLEQIRRMDDFLRARKENYARLTAGLEQIEEISLFQSSHAEFESSHYCHAVLLNGSLAGNRFEIVTALKDAGVGTSVYYPRAVPHLTYYREKHGYTDSSFPVAAWISDSSIALPVGPHLSPEDMDYVVDSLKKAILKVKSS
ncbi:MAG: DegT/DnrJ/EryC1/StrS family aminotransferase [bacterium]